MVATKTITNSTTPAIGLVPDLWATAERIKHGSCVTPKSSTNNRSTGHEICGTPVCAKASFATGNGGGFE
jgi:hypothetical protein